MEISTFIVTYSSIWSIVFLIALPIGAMKEGSNEIHLVTLKKIIYVSLFSIPLTFAVIYLVLFGVEL